jgi:hypothetical protein
MGVPSAEIFGAGGEDEVEEVDQKPIAGYEAVAK